MTGAGANPVGEFLAMGGYAFFVWTSYGVVLAVLILNVVVPWVNGRTVRRRLQRNLAAPAPEPSKPASNRPPGGGPSGEQTAQ